MENFMHIVEDQEDPIDEIHVLELSPLRHAAQTLGHALEPLSIIHQTLCAVARFIPNRRVRGALLIPSAVALRESSQFMIRHDRQLCAWCAARMPSDGAEQAKAHASDLEAAHAFTDHHPAAVIIDIAELAVVLGLRRLNRPGRVASAVIGTGYDMAKGHLLRTHNRLQPWCPQCHPAPAQDGSDRADGENDTPTHHARQGGSR